MKGKMKSGEKPIMHIYSEGFISKKMDPRSRYGTIDGVDTLYIKGRRANHLELTSQEFRDRY